MRSAEDNAAKKQGGETQAEPHVLLKRIGSTTYRVAVHFSADSKETLENKILRLIEREARNA